MKKVIAYIDGFNMYHGIRRNLSESNQWLDYRKLVQHYLWKTDELVGIVYFTAEPRWDKVKIAQHNTYLDVLKKHLGIHIVSGNYTSVSKTFISWKHPVIDPANAIVKPKKFTYKTFEEKQTDVNMALTIFDDGIMDRYDKTLLFTGDSDIAPSIQRVKRYKTKEFVSILPIGWRGRVISGICDSHHSITAEVLQSCLLPESVEVFGKRLKNPYK